MIVEDENQKMLVLIMGLQPNQREDNFYLSPYSLLINNDYLQVVLKKSLPFFLSEN